LKKKAFQKFWETLGLLTYWQNKSITDFSNYLEQYKEYNEMRNKAVATYRDIISDMLLQFNGRHVERTLGEFLQALDAINVSWQNLPQRTLPHIVQRKLILPIRVLSRKYKTLPIVNNLTPHLLQASHQYQNMRNLKEANQMQFNYYKNMFNGRAKLLERIDEILN
jgi:hypothetical protein